MDEERTPSVGSCGAQTLGCTQSRTDYSGLMGLCEFRNNELIIRSLDDFSP